MVFTYHHLPDFFHCSRDEVFHTLHSIEENPQEDLEIKNPSLVFFKRTIDYFLQQKKSSASWPKSQKLLTLKEFQDSLAQDSLLQESLISDSLNNESKRFKLKTALPSFLEWCDFLDDNNHLRDKILREKYQLVFDFNQTITDIVELKKLLHKTLDSKWREALFYFEEPGHVRLYEYLSNEELGLIALDESLVDLYQLNPRILENAGFFVVKPSLLEESIISSLLERNTPISLSSSYEHPSLKLGYLPYLQKDLRNTIHGLSTFDLFV